MMVQGISRSIIKSTAEVKTIINSLLTITWRSLLSPSMQHVVVCSTNRVKNRIISFYKLLNKLNTCLPLTVHLLLCFVYFPPMVHLSYESPFITSPYDFSLQSFIFIHHYLTFMSFKSFCLYLCFIMVSLWLLLWRLLPRFPLLTVSMLTSFYLDVPITRTHSWDHYFCLCYSW